MCKRKFALIRATKEMVNSYDLIVGLMFPRHKTTT